MSDLIWNQLEGDYPELNLRLRNVLSSDRAHATFLADYLKSRVDEREALVRLFLEDGNYPVQRVDRLLEATFFEHPHILRNFEAGTLSRSQFTFTYTVTERGDPPAGRFLDEREAVEFASQIISALRYLHSKNLVYCMLSPETVVKIGADWKLGDFSELRVTGHDDGYGTLSLAARVDTTPPEAVEGVISSAWDIWSFGQTLRRLLRRELTDFKSAVLACLNVNPSSRPSLDQLSSLLPSPRHGGIGNRAGSVGDLHSQN
jgi:serine/threonine protein kinase